MRIKLTLMIAIFLAVLLFLPVGVQAASTVKVNIYTYDGSASGQPSMYADKITIYNSTYSDSCTVCKLHQDYLVPGKTYYINVSKAGYNPVVGRSIYTISPGPITDRIKLYSDSESPKYSNEDVNPDSPATYLPTATYDFKITWTDNNAISTAKLIFNGISYWYPGQLTKTGNVYSIILPAQAAKPSGYDYQWWANDTAGKTNQTGTLSYVINKALQTAGLVITPDITVTYPTSITATASTTGTGAVTLKRDGNVVSNPETMTFPAGTYKYNASVAGNENYSASFVENIVTVDKYPTTATLLFVASTSGSITLHPDFSDQGSTRSDEGIPAVSNPSRDLDSGVNINFVGSTIDDSSSAVNPDDLGFDIPDEDRELDTGSGTRAEDASIDYGEKITVTCTEDSAEAVGKLFKDNVDITSTEAGQKILLPAGSYDYNCTVDASQNYSAAFDSATLTVNKADPNPDPDDALIHLELNGAESDLTIAQGQQVNATGWKEFSEGSLILLRDANVITNPEVRSDLGIGVYNYTLVYAATQNYSSASVTRFVTIYESEPPQWSENKSDIPSVYSDTINSEFEMTWTDNVAVDTVLFRSNYSESWANYSMTRVSGDVQDGQYEYQNILPSGYHCWNSWANDTSDNWNKSDTWCFTIDKDGIADVDLYLDDTENSITVQYNDVVNITTTTTVGNLALYVTDPSNSVSTYSGSATSPIMKDVTMNQVGLWNITADVANTVSYDGDSVTYWVNVTKKDVDDPNDPVMHIAINDTEADREMGIKEPINVTAWTDITDVVSAVLYRTNSTHTINLGNVPGTTPLSDIIAADTLSKGLYNYTLVYPGSINYNAGSVTRWLTINRTNITDPQNPLLHLELDGSSQNLTVQEETETNATGFRDFSEGGNITLYRDKVQVDNAAMTVEHITTLNRGMHNYTVYFPGSENYTDGSVTYFVNVTKRDPVEDGSLEAWLNGTAGNISGVVHYPGETSIVVNATSWTNITGGTLTIYRNGFSLGTKYNSGNNVSFIVEDSVGPGLHNYTFVIDETTNYAAGSITLWANITATYNWTKELKAGWNLISLPVIPTNIVLTSDATIWGTTYVIQHYNSTTGNWYEYNSTSPGSANLTSVEPNWGYWVYVANDQTININGTIPSTTSVSLKEGLNMVGWTSAKQTLMKDALASIIDDVDYVECQYIAGVKNVSQCYPPAGDSFELGKGYFINMTNDSDWNYTDNFKPVANAGPDITQHSGKVRLDASDSYDPDGKITGYRWNLGNGIIRDGKVVDYNFLDGGVYNVTLMVQDNDGATDTDEMVVTIGAGGLSSGGARMLKPRLDMFIGVPKEITIAPGEIKEITFTVKSTGQADIFEVEVDVDGPSDWLSEDSFEADTIKTGKSKSFSFEVSVPEDEEEGTETITVSASANGLGIEDKDIILNIKAEEVVPNGSDDGGDTGPTGLFLLEPNVIAGLVVILLLAIGAGYHYGKKGKTPTATSKTTQLEATSETPSTPGSTKEGSGAEFSIEYK